MKKHTRIYLEYFDYPAHQDTVIPCEVCSERAVDIHHINARGMGGSKHKDTIENLMALCRRCHNKAEAREYSAEELKIIHNEKLR